MLWFIPIFLNSLAWYLKFKYILCYDSSYDARFNSVFIYHFLNTSYVMGHPVFRAVFVAYQRRFKYIPTNFYQPTNNFSDFV